MSTLPAEFPTGATTTDRPYEGWKFLRDCREAPRLDGKPPRIFPTCFARVIVPTGSTIMRSIRDSWSHRQTTSDAVIPSNDFRTDALNVAEIVAHDGSPCEAGKSPYFATTYTSPGSLKDVVDTTSLYAECVPGLHFFRTRGEAAQAAQNWMR